MERTQWLKERQKGIGGSDVAAALGLSRYKTPSQLYFDKTSINPIEIPDNPKMRAGRKLENVIAEYYSEDTGHKVTKSNQIIIHKDIPFFLANVDRFILPLNGEGRGILECKTSSTFAFENWEAEIPQEYYLQIQHYFNCTGLKWGAFGLLLNGWDFRIIPVERNQEIIDMMSERLQDFWNNYVIPGIVPPPTTKQEISDRFSKATNDKICIANTELTKLVNELKIIKSEMKTLELKQEDIEVKIQAEMQDSDSLVDTNGNTLITWKQTKDSSSFDKRTFELEHPELVQKYTVAKSGYRRFLLNAKIN